MDQPVASIGFIEFVVSLARTAAVHFGDREDPQTGTRRPPDLPAARQLIEIIAMLQDRTKGNLTEPEEQLLGDLLYDLRMRYVRAREEGPRIVE